MWPERVEAHTRLDCSTSKVRNPQNCQAASSDHQIALQPRDLPSPVANLARRDLEQAQPNLGGTSLISKHCSSNTAEEMPPVQEKASSSQDVSASLMGASSDVPSPTSKMRDEKELEDEDEDEEEEEDDSLSHELHYESERFAESVDEDSLNLDFEMEGEEDEPEPQQPSSRGEEEAIESESESDPLYEVEDEEDGSLAMLGTEQNDLVGAVDEDEEDSLIPDIDMESEEEEEDGELSQRITQTNLPQSWETDEDDSEEEMYQNLPSASATDEEEAGWVNSTEKENKGSEQLHEVTELQGVVEDKRSSSKEVEEEEPFSEVAICQEREESSSSKSASLSRSNLLEKGTESSQEAFPEPLIQETTYKAHQKGDEDKEEHTHEEEDKGKHTCHSPSDSQLTCSTKTNHEEDEGASKDDISYQDSKGPVTLSLSVLESPSTSKWSDNSLNFEGFDREKTIQASARLLMLLKVRYLQPQHKSQSWKPKTAPRRRGRPSLRGRIKSVRGKRSGNAPVKRKRSQRAASTSTTSDSDEGQDEEAEGAGQVSRRGRGGRSGRGWIKQRRARGRPNKRKIRHSPMRKKTLHRHHRKITENPMEKRKTRSSDKEKEKEEEPPKITRRARDPYERFAHSPDITSFSEAKPRQPRNWSGTKGVEDKTGQPAPPENPPVKRARKRKPSEVDNLLQWAVETGHTGSRNRVSRERQNSITSTSTTSNNNNTNNNNNNLSTRRSRLETKMANKVQKKRGRKKKVRTDTEDEEEEDVDSGKQGHSHSSSDDPLINSEEELSDTGKGRGEFK